VIKGDARIGLFASSQIRESSQISFFST
jgi:hypothetical protein